MKEAFFETIADKSEITFSIRLYCTLLLFIKFKVTFNIFYITVLSLHVELMQKYIFFITHKRKRTLNYNEVEEPTK